MYSESRVTSAWNANRPYLTNLAFGILGDLGGAEDAVQEAFARLLASDDGLIQDERGWLIVVTSRICFDKIKSAPRRLEHSRETPALEEIATGRSEGTFAGDPVDRVTLDDEVRLALLVVLQRLTPAERVVFVLHDIFKMPFEAIAKTVGKSTPSCRQLARRARLKLQNEEAVNSAQPLRPSPEVTERFIEACSTGDTSRLVALLDPSVDGDVDLGPADPRTGTINHRADVVAPNLIRFFGQSTLVAVPYGARPVILSFQGERLAAAISLTLKEDLVTSVHVLADPEKMAVLDAQLS